MSNRTNKRTGITFFTNACVNCKVPDFAPCPKVARIIEETGSFQKIERCEWRILFDLAHEVYVKKGKRGRISTNNEPIDL